MSRNSTTRGIRTPCAEYEPPRPRRPTRTDSTLTIRRKPHDGQPDDPAPGQVRSDQARAVERREGLPDGARGVPQAVRVQLLLRDGPHQQEGLPDRDADVLRRHGRHPLHEQHPEVPPQGASPEREPEDLGEHPQRRREPAPPEGDPDHRARGGVDRRRADAQGALGDHRQVLVRGERPGAARGRLRRRAHAAARDHQGDPGEDHPLGLRQDGRCLHAGRVVRRGLPDGEEPLISERHGGRPRPPVARHL